MADDGSPNPYIRTYAKDMAERSGKTEPAPAVAPVTSTKHVDAEREAVLARLRDRSTKNVPAAVAPAEPIPPTVPQTEPAPAIASPAPAAHAPDVPSEHLLELPEHTVTVEGPGSTLPTPPPITLPVPAAPSPRPPAEPVLPPQPMAPASPAPVAPIEVAAAPTPILPPERAVPIPEPIRQPAPTPPPAMEEPAFTSIPTLIPKTPAPIAPTPAPITSPVAPEPAAARPSPLHTYSSDFADRIDQKGASAFSVLAAESDASAKKTGGAWKPSTNLMVTVAGIVLVLAGGTGLYFAYQYVVAHRTVALAPSIPSLIFADDRQEIRGEGSDLLSAIAASADAPLPDGQVRVLYVTESTTTASGATQNVPLSGGQLIGALQLAAPDMLLRNIAPESTVGIVHAGKESKAFFILKVLSYERTFAGMLQWEPTLQPVLAPLYPLYPAPEAPPPTVATTTKIVNGKKVVATTTVSAPAPVVAAPQFVDEVASNHDVRALKDAQGRTILLYGYKDKDTLIIVRDEAAFAELIARLAATKQQ